MIHVDTLKISIPLKKKFAISGGEADAKTNVLALMNNRYSGEAAGSVAYGPPVEDMEIELRTGAELLAKATHFDINTLSIIDEFEIHPVARSALICMVLNYLSGESKKYPWELLSLGAPVGIKSSITVGIDEPEAMLESLAESDNPIVKVKLGCDRDAEIIDAMSAIQGKAIRVDANGAWSLEKAEEMIYYLARNGVTIVEQPTDIDHIEEWQRLKGKYKEVELVLDEGLNNYEDYLKHSEFIDGVNIKMEKCGGILQGIRIANKARADKRKVMLGCMVESSIGIAQSLYMSSLADYWDLDGPMLLEDDIASGIVYDKESIEVDHEIIGGPKLKRDIVEKYIQP